MTKISCLFLKQDDLNALTRATVQALDIPVRACHHRHCRRHRSCSHAVEAMKSANCLAHLPPDMCAAFHELRELTVLIADDIRAPYPSRTAAGRALQEKAIGIILAARRHRPALAPRFDQWLAHYRRHRPEDIDNDPFWQRVIALKRKSDSAPKADDNATPDEVLNLRENGQFLVPDGADPDDFRNYR